MGETGMTNDNIIGVSTEFCEWNPKKLPNEKIGTCQNSEHDDWTDDKPKRNNNVRLRMMYSNVYENRWLNLDKSKLPDEEFDRLYDEYETKKWKPNTEEYWCDECCEVGNDQ